MRFYLRVINPALALTALLLCTWAAVFSENSINFFGIVGGSFTSYFFAKGLFTCGALFLLGKLLEAALDKGSIGTSKIRSERALFAAFLFGIIGLFAGLHFWGKSYNPTQKAVTYDVKAPASLTIAEYHPVRETDRLSIGLTLKNGAATQWSGVRVNATLYIGGRYSATNSTTVDNVGSGATVRALIPFGDFRNDAINDSVTCEFLIEANPKRT